MVHVAILLVLILIALLLAPWLIMVIAILFGAIAYWLAENFLSIAIFLASFVAAFTVLYFGRKKLLAALLEKPRAKASFKKVDLSPEASKTEEHWSERVKRLGTSKNVKTQTGRESEN